MDRRISLLRVLACFLVVLLHVSAANFYVFSERWWAANAFDSLSRVGVPIFFMVAGATLLRTEEPLAIFLRKRLTRILPPLLLWSVFYLWWLDRGGNWLLAIIAGPTMFHLWYFYAVLGLYAFVPVLRHFVQNCTVSELAWYLGLWVLVSSVLPTGVSLLRDQGCGTPRFGRLADIYDLTYFGGHAGYLVLGSVLRGHATRLGGWRVGLPVFLLGSAGTALLTDLRSRSIGAPCEFFYEYHQPLVILAAAGLFIAVAGGRRGEPSPLLQRLASATVGIYGLHIAMIELASSHAGPSAGGATAWLVIPLLALAVFAACFAVVDTLRRIRPLRVAV